MHRAAFALPAFVRKVQRFIYCIKIFIFFLFFRSSTTPSNNKHTQESQSDDIAVLLFEIKKENKKFQYNKQKDIINEQFIFKINIFILLLDKTVW
jgi:hypothetical protein